MNTSNLPSLLTSIASTAILGLALVVSGCAEATVNTLQSRNAGIKQYNDGEYAEAAGTFRSTIRSNPSDYGSHYFLGACLAKMGQYEQAIEQYKATLVIMSNDLVGREDHAFRLQCLNSLADAAVASKDRDTQSILVAGAPAWESQFLLAKIARAQGDADAAVEAYSQAALLAPKEFAIAKENGLYLLQLSQKDKARVELRRAYALNSKDEQVASALRQVGVVPGPSLKNEDDLAKPIVPVGPIPEVDLVVPASGKPQ
ncbi:MAG TPA: tetratricopeptide repeat protein [Tepidisphaeraceae bacterium]|jgi:tetratricopeptide (TPR) repeat protein|nr:tetratricopeptide repeat protein [Tepidisphaeraceae bacterium]